MIIADTGFWLALQHREDAFHPKAVSALKSINEPLITTTPVLSETCYLLQRELGWTAPIRLLQSIDAGLAQLDDFRENDLLRVVQLMKKYRELPMDMVDASLVILAEKLGHGRILSTDRRDFKTYRWKNTKPFLNLLEQE